MKAENAVRFSAPFNVIVDWEKRSRLSARSDIWLMNFSEISSKREALKEVVTWQQVKNSRDAVVLRFAKMTGRVIESRVLQVLVRENVVTTRFPLENL